MKISIIIPILNNVRYLKNLIPTIKSKDHELKIICINNGSTDGTFDYLKQFETDPKYHIEHYKDPLGVAVAWNRGIKLSLGYKADYSYILNTDVALHPEAIDNLVSFFEDKKVVIGSSFNVSRIIDSMFFGLYNLTRAFSDDEIYYYTNKLQEEPLTRGDNLIPDTDFSAFLINPQKLISEIGWFDENFKKCYFEDTDMVERIVKKGLQLGSTVNSLVLHFHSRGKWEDNWSIDHFSDNLKYFMTKYDKKIEDLDPVLQDHVKNGVIKLDD